MFKKVSLLIIGLFIISCAINIMVISNFGASPWDSATFTTSELFNLSPGAWLFIYGILLTLLVEVLNINTLFSKRIMINMVFTILVGLILGALVNVNSFFLNQIIPPYKVLGILGILLFGLGVAFIAKSKLPGDPISNFTLRLVETKNISVIKARLITDILGIGIAIIFGYILWNKNLFSNHYLGIGTVIFFIALPFCIKFFIKLLKV